MTERRIKLAVRLKKFLHVWSVGVALRVFLKKCLNRFPFGSFDFPALFARASVQHSRDRVGALQAKMLRKLRPRPVALVGQLGYYPHPDFVLRHHGGIFAIPSQLSIANIAKIMLD